MPTERLRKITGITQNIRRQYQYVVSLVKFLEVDWAGSILNLQDRATGEKMPVYVVFATLP